MPLPKGVYSDPAVRQAWREERRPILAEFDRLVAGGLSANKAAKRLGRTSTSILVMREGLEGLEERADGGGKGERSQRIDLGLALLSFANPPGAERQALAARDIAAWCDCSHATIQSIERRAMQKVRRKLEKLLGEEHAPAEVAMFLDLAA